MDFFTPLNSIGKNFADQLEQGRRQQTLADLGKGLTGANPDYGSAAAMAFSEGDANLGLGLLGLGEKARQRQTEMEADAKAGPLIYGGLMAPQSGAPAARPSAGLAPAPAFKSLPVSQNVIQTVKDRSPAIDQSVGAVLDAPVDPWNSPERVAGRLETDKRLVAQADAEDGIAAPLPPSRPNGLGQPPIAASNPDAVDRLRTAMVGQRQAADTPAPGAAEAQFTLPGGESVLARDVYANPRLQGALKALTMRGASAGMRAAAQKVVDDELTTIRQNNAPTNEEKLYRKAREAGETRPFAEWLDRNQKEDAATSETKTREARIAQADKFGLKQGTPEWKRFVIEGKAPEGAVSSEDKAKSQRQQLEQTGSSVFNALDDVDRIMSTSRWQVAGSAGSMLSNIPGTNAHDVASALNTVKANASFERLNQMRQSSPTGGALGAVSDSEQKLLSGSLAALEQSQSEEQFSRNLKRTRATFERIVHGKVLSPEERQSTAKARDEVSSPQAAQPAAVAPPKRGELIDGHRYKGGNPADPSSWVKVQ